jgi:hypothetical protein
MTWMRSTRIEKKGKWRRGIKCDECYEERQKSQILSAQSKFPCELAEEPLLRIQLWIPFFFYNRE